MLLYDLSDETVSKMAAKSWPKLINELLDEIINDDSIMSWKWTTGYSPGVCITIMFKDLNQQTLFLLKYT